MVKKRLKLSAAALSFLVLLLCPSPSPCRMYQLLEEDSAPKDAKPMPFAHYNFDLDALGAPPVKFDAVSIGVPAEAKWEVQHDSYAPSKPNVLVQSAESSQNDSASALLLKGVLLEQGEISVRFRTISLDDEQAIAILFYYEDPQNYFALEVSSRYDACSLLRVSKGKRKILATRNTIITPLKWHTAQVIFTPKTFTFLINKELFLGGKIKGLEKGAQVGFASLANSAIAFDDFQVTRESSHLPASK